MMKNKRSLSRRQFMKTAGSLPLIAGVPPLGAATPAENRADRAAALLHWLDGRAPALSTGTTWGVPWPRDTHPEGTTFTLRTSSGRAVPLQTWPLAYWPDGSLKWTGHAIGAASRLEDDLSLSAGVPAPIDAPVSVREDGETISIDTTIVRCVVAKSGSTIIRSIVRDGREIARNGRLVCLRQDAPDIGESGSLRQEAFSGQIEQIAVEQSGPIRVVVKIEGHHSNDGGRAWLPFSLRLYFYAGGETVRVMHTFVFDGDEQRDFIRGLGLRFDVPLRDELHDRHVRFAGESKGLWAEGVRNLTGLRRDPGRAVVEAQLAGRSCPPLEERSDFFKTHLDMIPAFGDFTLSQPTADSFEIRKRTRREFTWLGAAQGRRASGLGYVGGVSGGVAFGLRDFWQRHPTQLDIRGATGDEAQVTLWLWAPDAAAMDLRFYHDGMGQDTYEKQLQGLEITYEDYEPGFATPHGIARTSELVLFALAATPSRERLIAMAEAVRAPAAIVCRPEHYRAATVFGGLWSLPDRSTPARRRIEERLDWSIDFYQKQIEQRRWYGFWHYGDVMHTYDRDRHVWRYDVGGFAWDNSELSPDLWLWYSFLRTGRADVFRTAEAMTRHTGEVDVYHLGRFAGLGSRHNVIHWGCSAKQLRISNAAYRRFYYYLTADERVGDLLRELVDSDRALLAVNPVRKIAHDRPDANPHPALLSFGTDWSALAAAWLTEWERTRDGKCRDKIVAGMRSIGAMPRGYFTSSGGYDPATGRIHNIRGDRASVSQLSAVFGAVEIYAELIQLLDVPEFDRAWLQYCELYNADAERQTREMGRELERRGLQQAHSRLTAYAAWRKRDPELAARAWREFFSPEARMPLQAPTLETTLVEGPAVLSPVEEAPWVSTNGVSQWALAAMQNLALVPDQLQND